MKLFVSIFAIGFALGHAHSSQAEKIASPQGKPSLSITAGTDYNANSPAPPLPPAKNSLSLIEMKSSFYPSLKGLTRCDLRTDQGYGMGVVLVDKSEQMHSFAHFVPEDLIKANEPLKQGMKRSKTYVLNGITSEWTATYDKGKLLVENSQNSPYGKLYSEGEFYTQTTMEQSQYLTAKSWYGGQPDIQSVTCGNPLVSSLKKKSRST